MKEIDLKKILDLNNKTITFNIDDEYTQLIIRKEIEKYEKEVEQENKKNKMINHLKAKNEEYIEKEHLVQMLKSRMVINTIRDILIKEGFSYRCPTCLDLSGQYGRPIKSYPKYNRDKSH